MNSGASEAFQGFEVFRQNAQRPRLIAFQKIGILVRRAIHVRDCTDRLQAMGYVQLQMPGQLPPVILTVLLLAAGPLLLALFLADDLSQQVRIRRELLHHIIRRHDPDETAVIAHNRYPSHAVNAHPLEHL